MTVGERIKDIKKSNSKVSRIWICPEIVKHPRVGAIYSYAGGMDYTPGKGVTELQEKKYWIEDNTLCIIYIPEGEPIVFA